MGSSKPKPFTVNGYICDSPARAFITGVQYFTGKSGCPKCAQRGVSLQNRVCYSQTVGELRTDEKFKAREDPTHHAKIFLTEKHVLELINVNMVSQFPLDPMHLIDLGVTKKWLNLVVNKSNIQQINKKMEDLRNFIPSEFGRICRPLSDLKLWKATEFRQFLLYIGIFVLKNCVEDDIYYNFLLLHTGIRLLSSHKTCFSEMNIAQEILEDFVESFANIFGSHLISFNVHGLLHLTDCVRLYGPLDNFSAYKFENHMQLIKKVVRKPNKILQQIYLRMAEINTVDSPEIEESNASFTSNFIKEKDCYCYIKNRGPCKIVGTGLKSEKQIFLGYLFEKTEIYFDEPVNSVDSLGILVAKQMSESVNVFFEEDISYKYLALPYDDNFILIPLLHIFHDFF